MIATSKKFVLDENKKEEINNNRITTQRFQNTFSVMADRTCTLKILRAMLRFTSYYI